MRFRERDGVCVQYEVRGIQGSEAFPYVNDLPSLKEAVAIARRYPGVYRDGSATHVLRRYSKRLPGAASSITRPPSRIVGAYTLTGRSFPTRSITGPGPPLASTRMPTPGLCHRCPIAPRTFAGSCTTSSLSLTRLGCDRLRTPFANI